MFIEIWSTQEVLKRTKMHKSCLRLLLECSSNFPSASYLDECTADIWTNCFITFILIFSNLASLKVAKWDDTSHACSLFSFPFHFFGGVKNSIPREKVGSSSSSTGSQLSMFSLVLTSFFVVKSQSKKLHRKFFFLRDLFADVMSMHNRNMKHAHAIEFNLTNLLAML